MTAPRLTAVQLADTICVEGPNGERQPWFVMRRCESPAIGYCCVAHQAHLSNVGDLVLHCEESGAHLIAVWCPRHAVYEAADPAQLAALEAAAA